ncbi:MAG: arsenate reductase ArsC [Candidatus Aminicenantes bacterium]|nr:arsenate reductase ArsC [Candidatus Aminicenantes bacterium]
MKKAKVLFICTGNSARSQMAEAFLRKYAGDEFEAYSAGIRPLGIAPYTIRVMEEVGISLEGHGSKHVDEYMGKIDFDYLITVCANAEKQCPVFLGAGERIHWDIEDPAMQMGSEEEKLQKFREVRDKIDKLIKEWISNQD